MNDSKNPMEVYWDNYNKKFITNEISQLQDRDDWLKKYAKILSQCESTVLELGCGQGNTTELLVKYCKDLLATDILGIAVAHTQKRLGERIRTQKIDIESTLPFADSAFVLVVADLSLHYFTTEKTIEIMKEIKRVLKPNGYLLARVNSTEDKTAQGEEEIENNVYLSGNSIKRFFNKTDAEQLFGIIGQVKMKKTEIICHYKKKAIEVLAKKGG